MSKQVETIMIASDFEGSKYDSTDCIGYRSFKRAHRASMNVILRFFDGYIWRSWGTNTGHYGSSIWTSYKDGQKVSMMGGIEVGDHIIFNKNE